MADASCTSWARGGDSYWDSLWLWIVARQRTRALAALLQVHPDIDQTDFLAAAAELVEAEKRIEDELERRRAELPPTQQA